MFDNETKDEKLAFCDFVMASLKLSIRLLGLNPPRIDSERKPTA